MVRSDVHLRAPHKNLAKLTGNYPAHLLNRTPLLISIKLRLRRSGLEFVLSGALGVNPYASPFVGLLAPFPGGGGTKDMVWRAVKARANT